jgi:hypothetical protein
MAIVHAAHDLDELLPALLHVVFGTNRKRFQLALRAHDVLKRSAKFGCKSGVSNNDDADHRRDASCL